jgi:hypothetical protein
MVVGVAGCAERMKTSPRDLEDVSVADVLCGEASRWIGSSRDDVLVNRWLGQAAPLTFSEDVNHASLMVAVAMREEDGREGARLCGGEDDVEQILHILGRGGVLTCAGQREGGGEERGRGDQYLSKSLSPRCR